MRNRQPGTGPGRAIIGVIALYALLLQAFLAVAAPTGPSFGPGVLCTVDGEHAPGEEPLRHDHQCCTAQHVGNLAPAPKTASAERLTWPVSIRIVWRPEAELPRTGPPTFAHSARGPPSA